MIPERALNIFTGILLFIIMGVVAMQLSEGWRPDQIYLRIKHPAITEQAFKKAEFELNKYKVLYRDNDRILSDISRARIK